MKEYEIRLREEKNYPTKEDQFGLENLNPIRETKDKVSYEKEITESKWNFSLVVSKKKI